MGSWTACGGDREGEDRLGLGLLGVGPGYQCARPHPGRGRLRRCPRGRGQPGRGLRALAVGWLWLASRRERTRRRFMAFQVKELSIQLVEELAPVMPRIRQRDKSLADQLARAVNSV